jgi:hypothetical protein
MGEGRHYRAIGDTFTRRAEASNDHTGFGHCRVGSMDIPFSLRATRGHIDVDLRVNDDPARLGCDHLLFGESTDLARDYPVCTATVHYEALGYNAVCGLDPARPFN